MKQAEIFLDRKQDEYYDNYGVFVDDDDLIADWVQEYADKQVELVTDKVEEMKIIQLRPTKILDLLAVFTIGVLIGIAITVNYF